MKAEGCMGELTDLFILTIKCFLLLPGGGDQAWDHSRDTQTQSSGGNLHGHKLLQGPIELLPSSLREGQVGTSSRTDSAPCGPTLL